MDALTNPRDAVQMIHMDYENVSQVSMETRATDGELTLSVSAFIDAEQDDRDYASLLTTLFDAGFEVDDKGLMDSGRRLVKGSQEL